MKRSKWSGNRVVVGHGTAWAACVALAACGVDTDGLFSGTDDAGGVAPFGAVVDAQAGVDASRDASRGSDATAHDGDSRDSGLAVSDASVPADGPVRPPPPPPPPRDASVADVGADVGISSPCDADGDGHRALGCGGDDCCDLDPDVYPRTTTRWWPGAIRFGGYDHDCVGMVYLRYGQVACSVAGQACGGEGFATLPVCGMTGSFQSCNLASGFCAPDFTSGYPRIQECR
jgi:hypothetical protein